jgi:hypothetical protein
MLAANLAAEEKNEEWKLHFMLHVDTQKSKWTDMPIPFPAAGPRTSAVPGDVGGVKQLQWQLPGFPVKVGKASKPPQSNK